MKSSTLGWVLLLALLAVGPHVSWLSAAGPSSRRNSGAKPPASSESELTITEDPPAVEETPVAPEDAPAETASEEPSVLEDQPEKDPSEMPDEVQEGPPARVITPLEEDSDRPTREDIHPASATRLQPARLSTPRAALTYREVQPGVSTKKELVSAWGAPAEVGKSRGVVTYTYRPKDAWKATVTLTEGVVSNIVLQIPEPQNVGSVTESLGIDKVSSVEVADEDGQILGEAFPECGVLFAYAPQSQPSLVAQVILEPLDAQPFLLRAEAELESEYARCLADANCALELEPQSGAANSMRARVYRQAGDLQAALQAAEAAVSVEPAEPEWRLVLGKILLQLSDFNRAKEQANEILLNSSSDTLSQAAAHLLMGDVLAMASNQGHAEAVKHDQEAIKLAKTLATDPSARRQRKAAEILVDAHLHAAYSIGWGDFQHKAEAVQKWIDGAQGQAEHFVKLGLLPPDVQLKICEQALSAMAGLPDPPDPTKLEELALHLAKKQFDDSHDPARAAQVQWQLGLALCDAMQIEQSRRAYSRALNFGRLAVEHLQRSDTVGRQLPDHDFLIGMIFYRLGAIHAVGRKDHKQALAYYHPAIKLLEAPVPSSRFADPGRHGEMFVSIAVSYWETGEQEEAVRLTRQGVKMMERAIEEGLMTKSALAVPYDNLSHMYAELGDSNRAMKYAEMANKFQRQQK